MRRGAAPLHFSTRVRTWLRFGIALLALLIASVPARAFADDHVRAAAAGALTKPAIPASYVTEKHDFGTIAFEPRARERVGDAMKAIAGYRATLRARMGHEVLNDVDVRIVASPEEMRTLAPQELAPPAYATGVAYPSVKLVLVSLIEPRSFEGTDLAEVLKHELVHIAIDEALEGARVPRWFNEGIAIHESGENAGARIRTLAEASMSSALIPIAQLDRAFGEDSGEVSTAYAQSADFVRFLVRSEDQDRFRSLMARVRGGATFERALEDAYDARLNKLEYQWREQVGRRYAYYPAIFASSLVWVAVLGVLGWGYMKKKRRSRAILARWAREEALEDARVAERWATVAPRPSRDESTDLRRPALPAPTAPTAIEHDGRIYNVH